jgi:hypothetical protein
MTCLDLINLFLKCVQDERGSSRQLIHHTKLLLKSLIGPEGPYHVVGFKVVASLASGPVNHHPFHQDKWQASDMFDLRFQDSLTFSGHLYNSESTFSYSTTGSTALLTKLPASLNSPLTSVPLLQDSSSSILSSMKLVRSFAAREFRSTTLVRSLRIDRRSSRSPILELFSGIEGDT